MTFRLLNTNDYEAYLELINEFRPTQFTEQQFKETLTDIQRHNAIWVYEDNKALLATGTILYEHKFIHNICIYAHIEDVCVKKLCRGNGLGKRLISHLISQASHCHKINLNCAEETIKFYEYCGFERKGNQMSLLVIKK